MVTRGHGRRRHAVTDGLGRALALRLATEDDVRLVLHGRDPAKLERLLAEVLESGATAPVTATADLSDLDQVAGLADTIADSVDTLDVLVNNAGIGSGEPDGRERRTSRDGHELRFAVNYLATFLLTENLLPLLRASTTTQHAARVVHVSSLGQHPLDFDDLMLERGYSGTRAYGQSKLAQIMHCFDLGGRFAPSELTATCLHPGTYLPTKIVLSEIGVTADTLHSGAEATRGLAVDPALERRRADPVPAQAASSARHSVRSRWSGRPCERWVMTVRMAALLGRSRGGQTSKVRNEAFANRQSQGNVIATAMGGAGLCWQQAQADGQAPNRRNPASSRPSATRNEGAPGTCGARRGVLGLPARVSIAARGQAVFRVVRYAVSLPRSTVVALFPA
ncbi:SDR family NAD(P)-dependent oxidoreductase [Streptomyces sp. NPDC044780]|uniref:SDR family NAD(P)-dependent oxidoreductase n=1 Tax=unclassified Streptomyces TaxID=2593676 RepID=UPI0033EC6B8C